MIRWDVHYWPYGEEVKDDVVELASGCIPKITRAKYKQDLKLYTLLMKGGELEIPPHGTAMTQGFHTFKTPVRIDSFQPHGHARLVGMTAEIYYPDTGKLEMVSSVSNWTNQWHTSHVYADDAAPLLPVGAVLVLTGYYDNTAKNKGNPDPISGWAAAAGRRTRCRTRGSRSRTSTTRATSRSSPTVRPRRPRPRRPPSSSRRGSSRQARRPAGSVRPGRASRASRGSFAFGAVDFEEASQCFDD